MRFPFVLRRRHEAALAHAREIAGVAFLGELDAAFVAAEQESRAAIYRGGKTSERERLRAEGAARAFRAAHGVAQKLIAVAIAMAEAED